MGIFRRSPTPPPLSARSVVPLGSLAASAQIIDTERSRGSMGTQQSNPKQALAWQYYGSVGELHHAAQFVANCLSRVVLRPGVLGDDDKVGPVYDEDGNVPEALVAIGVAQEMADLAAAVIRALKAPRGGQPRILAALGKDLTVAAECYLVGIDTLGLDGRVMDRSFEVLSTDELKPAGDGSYQRKQAPGATAEPLPEGSYVLRIWREHPQYSALADSSVTPLLDVLEEIILLTRDVRAQSVSRLAGAGVYWIPSEISFDEDEGAPDGADPFTSDLIKTMSTAIADPGSASATVPMVSRAPGEYIEKIRYDRFDPPDTSLTILKRQEAVQRFANGIDLPGAVVTGEMGNHWQAWQIEESTFKAYIEPTLELICDALTVGYLHKQLRLATQVPDGVPLPPDLARLRVWFDATQLVVHPNRESAAEHAFGSGAAPSFAISASAYRRAKGFQESDAPDDEEVAVRIAVAQALRQSTAAPDAGGLNAVTNPEQGAGDQEKGPPAMVASAARARLVAQLSIAGEHALERAVDRAGARLRDRVKGQRELAAKCSGIPSCSVAAALGPAVVERMLPTVDAFAGEFAAYSRLAQRWAGQAGEADPERIAVAALGVVEGAARRRLFDPAVSVDPRAVSEALAAVG